MKREINYDIPSEEESRKSVIAFYKKNQDTQGLSDDEITDLVLDNLHTIETNE